MTILKRRQKSLTLRKLQPPIKAIIYHPRPKMYCFSTLNKAKQFLLQTVHDQVSLTKFVTEDGL